MNKFWLDNFFVRIACVIEMNESLFRTKMIRRNSLWFLPTNNYDTKECENIIPLTCVYRIASCPGHEIDGTENCRFAIFSLRLFSYGFIFRLFLFQNIRFFFLPVITERLFRWRSVNRIVKKKKKLLYFVRTFIITFYAKNKNYKCLKCENVERQCVDFRSDINNYYYTIAYVKSCTNIFHTANSRKNPTWILKLDTFTVIVRNVRPFCFSVRDGKTVNWKKMIVFDRWMVVLEVVVFIIFYRTIRNAYSN